MRIATLIVSQTDYIDDVTHRERSGDGQRGEHDRDGDLTTCEAGRPLSRLDLRRRRCAQAGEGEQDARTS